MKVLSVNQGTITNTNLDGGNSSVHGYTRSSLPIGSTAILSNGNATQTVAFDYPFGSGHVLVHTLPVEFYNGGPHGIGSVFHRNLLDFGRKLVSPLPRLLVEDVSLSEGNTGTTDFSFNVKLSKIYSEPVSVEYTTSNDTAIAGEDYDTTSGTLTFNPGEAIKTITVKVIGDKNTELNENFFLNLSNPLNTFLTRAKAIGTITNDDQPDLQVSEAGFGKSEVVLGQTIPLSWTVTNSGNGTAENNWYDRVYLSSDANLDNADTEISSEYIDAQTPLASNANYTINKNYAVPSTLAPGSRYLIFATDRNNNQSESNETNNFKAVAINFAAPSLNLGQTVTSTIAQNKYFNFNLDTDSLLYFDALTNNSGFKWSLTGADGKVIDNRSFSSSDGYSINNPVVKVKAGSYLLSIDYPNTSETYSFRLSDLKTATDITLNPAVSDQLLPANQTDIYKFNADAGDRFLFDYLSYTGTAYGTGSTYWSLVDPDGNIVFDRPFNADGGELTLAKAGTYSLLMEGAIFEYLSGSNNGNYSFNVRSLKKEPNNLTLGETVTSTVLQQDQYKFTLNENSSLYFDSLTNNSNHNWTIKDQNGTTYYNRSFTQSDGTRVAEPVLKLAAGEYILDIDGLNLPPESTYSFKLSNLNQALPLTLGIPINDSFEGGKKTDLFRFDATAGERFFFDYQNMTGSAYGAGNAKWRLIDPNGSQVFDQRFDTDATNITTTQTGTYTLLIENYIGDYPSGGTNINYRFQVDPISADLTVTSATAPTSVTWGQPFTLNWQVANIGSLTSTGWSDLLYLSKDTTLDDNDVLLSTFNDAATTSLAKNASASRSKQVTINTLQNLDSSTNWHLLIKAQTNQRDANTSNDVRATAIQLLPPTHPDLVVSQVTAPTTGISGSEIEVNWQVKNQGNLTTNVNSWSDRILLSSDRVLDNSDRQLATVSHTGALNQNGIYSNTAKVRLPDEIAGDYYLLVDTDYGKQVFEFVYDQNNATSTTTPTTISLKPVPDLQVNSVTADTTGEPGENIKVNWQVSNTGAAAATVSWNDYVYLSPDGTLNNAIAHKSVPRAASLAINSNYQASTEFTLPDNLADGNYRILVLADGNNQVFERGGENNNSRVAANLTKVNHADLIPTLTLLCQSPRLKNSRNRI